MKNTLSILIITSALVTGCAQQTGKIIPVQNTEAVKTVVVSQAPVEKLAPSKSNLEIGKKYGEMTLSKVKDNSFTFIGAVEVQGDFFTSELDGNICMAFDKDSAKKIPNVPELMGLSYSASFVCFSNQEVAKKIFGSSDGKAKIAIEGYVILIDSSVPPMTTLIKVISKTK